MNYLSIDNISKAFSDKLLFENISFGIEKGEKTALVAANGTGKSTMMKILVGKEECDKGSIAYNENIRIGYLEQLPQFNPEHTIQEVISTGHTDIMSVIQRYENALLNHVDDNNLNLKVSFSFCGTRIPVSPCKITSDNIVTAVKSMHCRAGCPHPAAFYLPGKEGGMIHFA